MDNNNSPVSREEKTDNIAFFVLMTLMVSAFFNIVTGAYILTEVVWVDIMGNSTVVVAPRWLRVTCMVVPLLVSVIAFFIIESRRKRIK